jgi:basic membrane protein A
MIVYTAKLRPAPVRCFETLERGLPIHSVEGGMIYRGWVASLKFIFFLMLIVAILPEHASAQAKAPIKVAYLPCGRINDQSWSQAGYEGVVAAKRELGIEFAYSESVPPVDVEAAARDYASKGYNLVMLHCATFTDAGMRAAKDFPSTWFEVNSAQLVPPNVISFNMQGQEGAFLGGIVAGLATRTNKFGAIAYFNTLGFNRQIEGFRLGARFVNPKSELFVTYLNSAEDAAKAKEAALAQFDVGADVILAASDQAATGIFRAGDERGKYVVAEFALQNRLAPKVILGSVLFGQERMIANIIKSVAAGTAKGGLLEPGVKDGVGSFAANTALLDSVSEDAGACLRLIEESFASNQMRIPSDKIMGRQNGGKDLDTKTVVAGGAHPCLDKRL